MTSLVRKVAFFFWQYPILWLPTLCADFAVYWFNILHGLLSRQMLIWFLPHASVFGHDPEPLRPGYEHLLLAYWLTTPLNWIAWTGSIALYLSAFLFTASLAQQLLREEPLKFMPALQSLRPKLRKIILLSLAILLLYGLGTFLATSAYVLPGRHSLPSPQTIDVLVFATFVCLAALLAPLPLKLVFPSPRDPLQPAIRQLARLVAPLAMAAVLLLDFYLPQAGRTVLRDAGSHRHFVSTILAIIESMFAATPYIPLAIAFAILARQNRELPTIPEEPTAEPVTS